MIQQVIDTLSLAGAYTLFTLGLTLQWGVLKILNLAHGVIFMLAAFAAYLIAVNSQLPLPILIVGAMVAAAAISLLLELCLFRPIRARTGSFIAAELPTFLASIGVAGALEAWVDERTNGESLPVGSRFFSSHSYAFHHLFNITNLDVLVIVLGTLGTVGLAAWVAKARQGRAVRAVAYDATTARLMGINANLVASVTVAVGGAMAGLAGVLLAIRFGSVQFQMGDSLLLYALVIVVIGGQGSVWGAAVGSLAVALIQTEQVSYFPGIDPDLILFGMVIALLLVRPQGIAGAQVVEKL